MIGGDHQICLSSSLLDGLPDGNREEFFVDVLRIFGLFTSSEFPKTKEQFLIRWFYFMKETEESNKVEKKILLECTCDFDPDSKRKNTEANPKEMRLIFNLNNENRGLPLGNYSVEISAKDKLILSKRFKIVRRKGTYLGTNADHFGTSNPSHVFNGHDVVILGTHHFDGIMSNEIIKSGKIEWYKLPSSEEEEEEEELIYLYNVEIPEKGQFNVFRFYLPKEKLKDGKYAPGQYSCKVYVNDEVVDRHSFEIKKPEPKLFIGTHLTKLLDIVDDVDDIEGSSPKIIALYKFCRKIKGKIGFVKWFYHRVEERKRELIYEHKIDCKGLEYYVFVSLLDNQKRKLLPGRYSCEIFLEEDMIAKRRFLLLPRFEIELRLEEQNTPPSTGLFQEGVRKIMGSFVSNYVFPAGSEVGITWAFHGDGDNMKSSTKSPIGSSNQQRTILISKTKKKMEKKFARCDFFHEMKKEDKKTFPLGLYGVEISLGGKIVAIKRFRVLKKKKYEEELEKIRKTEEEEEELKKKKKIIDEQLQENEEEEEEVEGEQENRSKFVVVDREEGENKSRSWMLLVLLCFFVVVVAYFVRKYFLAE